MQSVCSSSIISACPITRRSTRTLRGKIAARARYLSVSHQKVPQCPAASAQPVQTMRIRKFPRPESINRRGSAWRIAPHPQIPAPSQEITVTRDRHIPGRLGDLRPCLDHFSVLVDYRQAGAAAVAGGDGEALVGDAGEDGMSEGVGFRGGDHERTSIISSWLAIICVRTR